MKHLLSSLLLLVCLTLISNTASAKGIPIPIFYGTGPKFVTEQQLPDSVIVEGKHVNFGVGFEQFSIFWVPIWNYGTTQYVLVTDDEKLAYTDLSDEELEYIKETYNIDTNKAPTIPFWHKIGGKIIWGAVLALIIWGIIPSKDKEEEEKEEEEEA